MNSDTYHWTGINLTAIATNYRIVKMNFLLVSALLWLMVVRLLYRPCRLESGTITVDRPLFKSKEPKPFLPRRTLGLGPRACPWDCVGFHAWETPGIVEHGWPPEPSGPSCSAPFPGLSSGPPTMPSWTPSFELLSNLMPVILRIWVRIPPELLLASFVGNGVK